MNIPFLGNLLDLPAGVTRPTWVVLDVTGPYPELSPTQPLQALLNRTESLEALEKRAHALGERRQVALGGPTRGWARAACQASDALIQGAGRIDARLLVLQAGEDTAVTAEGQEAFCARLQPAVRPQPCPLRIEGARHELLVEADRYRLPAMTAILDFFAQP